jgi:DNA repair protein SbcC/Rad50
VRDRLGVTPDGWRTGSTGATPAPDDPEALTALLAQVTAAEQAVAEARAEDRSRRQARDDHQARHEKLQTRETAARRQFDQARDRLALLDPPVPERTDLAADWSVLVAWGGEQRPALAEEVQVQRGTAEAAATEHRRRWQDLADLCREAGVEVPAAVAAEGVDGAGTAPVDQIGSAVTVARARAEDTVKRVAEQIAEAADLHEQRQAAVEQRQVAESLAGHLKANRFEKWLLDEAVLNLTASASDILSDLSQGAYSLSVDTKSGGFTVVDHANASQVRSARTLSGGETFLASLALALGLADQVAELATGGTARLETLFLDEGFGTLDADTLDVVATSLDELGARGRMVGIVTHVRDLAERLPVRFEVTKVGAESTVTRVEEG